MTPPRSTQEPQANAGPTDTFDLERFVRAQDGGTYERALAEVEAGAKRSHWMWFVLPQLAGLGRSATARRYAISGLPEARAYLRHELLGDRLRGVARALIQAPGTSAESILGSIDAVKLRSSMTLFALAEPTEPVFQGVLDRFWDGQRDERTLTLLGSSVRGAAERRTAATHQE